MQYLKIALPLALASSALTTPVFVADTQAVAPRDTTAICLTDDQAKYFVDSFVTLLEYTNYNGTQAPRGRGFNTTLATEILAESFTDNSDSINFLAQQPLGQPTFPNRAAFIQGQGAQPEVAVTVLKIWHGCDTVAFRYRLRTGAGADLPVLGLNVMELTPDRARVQTQYAEFDSAAWLVDLGNPQCAGQGRS